MQGAHHCRSTRTFLVRGRSAPVAEAEDLQFVVDVTEAVFPRDAIRPLLDGGADDLDRASAAATDEVMMVSLGVATPEGGLAVLADHVDFSGVRHRLQGPIDRGEPDGISVGAQEVVDLLRRPEVVDVTHQGADGRPLAGASLTREWGTRRRRTHVRPPIGTGSSASAAA